MTIYPKYQNRVKRISHKLKQGTQTTPKAIFQKMLKPATDKYEKNSKLKKKKGPKYKTKLFTEKGNQITNNLSIHL